MIKNPSQVFLINYEDQINQVRESLFSELGNISNDFGKEARTILQDKIISNDNKPLLGEIFPWIINDLIDGDTKLTQKLSVGWLAIYLYTLFLDEYVDNPKPLSSSKFITGSLLAKIGISKLGKATINSKYESQFDNAFMSSAFYQDVDVKFQKIITDQEIKDSYSSGKNRIVLACAAALAAQNSKYDKFIFEFTETLLLAFQYLDDIADYEDDFRSKNITVLLNELFIKNPSLQRNIDTISNKEILLELLDTGALQRVVEKLYFLIGQAIILMRESLNGREQNGHAERYMTELHYNIESFNEFLVEKSRNIKLKTIKEQNLIINNVERRLYIVSQST